MIMAFTSTGPNWESQLDPRFGRAPYFLIYDDEQETLIPVDNHEATESAHGAGPQSVKRLLAFKPRVLISGNGPGGNAALALRTANIAIFLCPEDFSVREALAAYEAGALEPFLPDGA